MTQTQTTSHHGGSFGAGPFGADQYGGYEHFDLPHTGSAAHGRRSTQWETCDRCGFIYPIAEMRIQPGEGGGAKVCVAYCLDQPSYGDLNRVPLPEEKPYQFVGESGPEDG